MSGELATTEGDPEPLVPSARDVLARGTAVDRFLILDEIGMGGMGVVYEAYDPKLDRKVAIKLVRRDKRAGDEADSRLVREARAMAQLSAPEVVAVFDAGTHEGLTFIAMELVIGKSLEHRLDASRERVIAWLVAAGCGLAAAHEVGIVHRDFKPSNVLISDGDGRAKVGDFGLANDPAAMVGTPRFMAPEQANGVADAKSDQFAFAITAWRVLAGNDPFADEMTEERVVAIREHRFQRPKVELPRRVRRALERALSHDPAARFASMRELIAELDRAPSTIVPYAIGSVVVIAAIVPAVVVRAAASAPAPGCEVAGELSPTWDPAARAKLEAQLAPLGGTGTRVRDAIDAYGSAWSKARVDACEATRVRKVQSDEAMDLRMACLDERRRDLAGLITASDSRSPKLIDAAYALPPIDRCARIDLLRRPAEPSGAEALRDKLRGAKLLYDLAKFADGKPLADEVVAASTKLDARALLAEAQYWQGRFTGQLGDSAGSEAILRAATRTGEAVRADEVVANARTALVFVIALQQDRFDRLDGWAADAEAAIARIGGDRALEARLHLNRGAVFEIANKSTEALAEFRSAEAGYEAIGGRDNPDVARVLTNAGTSLRSLNRLDEAEAAMERALQIYAKAYGDRHPQLGATLINLTAIARSRGDRDKALDFATRAVDTITATLGPDHPTMAQALGNYGQTLFFTEHLDEAAAAYNRSLEILKKANASPLQIALNNLALASIEAKRGRLDAAMAALDVAQPIFDKAHGPDDVDAQLPRLSRAEIRISLGKLDGVSAELDRVEAAFAKVKDNRYAPYLPRDRGLLALAEGKRDVAVKLLESVVEASFLDATDQAEAQFALARALDRGERAVQMATRARATYATAQGANGRDVKDIDAWLTARRATP